MKKTQTDKHKRQPVWIVNGGTSLVGSVRLSGAKNASFKLMIASLLGDSESKILNLPYINDVLMVKNIINQLGGVAKEIGKNAFSIDPTNLNSFEIDKKYGQVSRASVSFMPVLLSKFHEAKIPLPGGDKIGKRPLDRHLMGLEKMGAKIKYEDGFLHLKTDKRLKGVVYRFNKNTHTGTETMIMAAALAKGKTILENAALEPEIDDLIKFLNNMGAHIRRRLFRVIEIEGVEKLHGAIHFTMPDRNEAVTYACGAIATKGDIIIENARAKDLKAFIEKVEEAGGGVEIDDWGIRFFYKGELKATDIETSIHPGFMTDWQPLWATMIATANGQSIIHETVMQNRFQYVNLLQKMGVKVEKFNPKVKDPEKFYNFNWKDRTEQDKHAIRIYGPAKFRPSDITVTDLRAGATVLLASMNAHGKTIIRRIDQVKRGYEDIVVKLKYLGADIQETVM